MLQILTDNAMDCRQRLFRNIEADLAPWRETGITRELFERIKRRSWKGLHVKICGGKPIVYKEVPSFQTRNEAATLMLRGAASRHQLQDCEFILHTGDDPPASNLPMLAFWKRKGDKTILFPDFSFYSWLEALIPDIDTMRADLDRECRPWEKKLDRILCFGPGSHPLISQWAQRSEPWLDARIGDWVKNRAAMPSFAEKSRCKYVASLPGKTYLPVLKYLFLTNSLVIYSENEWLEFWHSILDFGKDCIRHDFAGSDSIDRLHEALTPLPDKELQRMAARGSCKVAQTLTLDTVYEYIARLINDYAALQRFQTEEKEYKLVIARYNEDVEWSSGHPRIIYNKGARIDGISETEQIMAPNVGREAHTYLTYILENYDHMPEMVMFCQGAIHDHVDGFRVEDFINPDYDVIYARLCVLKEWDPVSGRLMYPPAWLQRLKKESFRPSDLTYFEWFEKVLGVSLGDNTVYVPGAILAVSSKNIRKRPVEFYARLLEFVNLHPNPEEAHYLERSWLYIFAAKDMKVLHLN